MEILPTTNDTMVSSEKREGDIYKKEGNVDSIYIGWHDLYVSDYDAKIDYYELYVKEDNPELYKEAVAGFYDYIVVEDGKEMHTSIDGIKEMPSDIMEELEQIGTIDYCNENDLVIKKNYTGLNMYLGSRIYKDSTTGIYYLEYVDGSMWFELEE